MTASQLTTDYFSADAQRTSEQDSLLPVKSEARAIAARGLNMVFNTGNHQYPVLRDINLDVLTGDVQLLMGPSGSGKTTLLSILAGIMTPTSGHIAILGTDITQLTRTQLAKFRLNTIGFIFQGFNLFPALSAAENIELALKIKGYSTPNAREETARLLEQVGLGNKGKSYPRDLSGGQKQRVAIARALAGSPPIIMADEPTAALDSNSGHAVISLLRSLAKEDRVTVLMVTHDPRIKGIADRVTYLEDGMLKT